MPGSSSAVTPRRGPTRSIAGGSASPRPGSSEIAAPMRAITSTKANAHAGSVGEQRGIVAGHEPPMATIRSNSVWV